MIRKYLVTGLFTLLPLVVTLWLLKSIFSALTGIFARPLTWVGALLGLPNPPYWFLAFCSALATLLLLFLVGLLMGNFVGRQLLYWLDELMLSVPVVKSVYGSIKQLMSAVQSGQGGSFKEVVLVEWPQPGSWTLGFVAKRDCGWAMEGGESMAAVYIPTAPNPTSGYVVMVSEDKLKPVPFSPDQALTWAVSGGVVTPGGSASGEPGKP